MKPLPLISESGLEPSEYVVSHQTTTLPGKTVTLSCSVQADPAPSVTWIKVDRAGSNPVPSDTNRYSFINTDDEHHRYNFTMVINDVQLDDHNTRYMCSVSNRLGTTKSPKMTQNPPTA